MELSSPLIVLYSGHTDSTMALGTEIDIHGHVDKMQQLKFSSRKSIEQLTYIPWLMTSLGLKLWLLEAGLGSVALVCAACLLLAVGGWGPLAPGFSQSQAHVDS